MKKINANSKKKLNLNKRTIVRLNADMIVRLNGGVGNHFPTGDPYDPLCMTKTCDFCNTVDACRPSTTC